MDVDGGCGRSMLWLGARFRRGAREAGTRLEPAARRTGLKGGAEVAMKVELAPGEGMDARKRKADAMIKRVTALRGVVLARMNNTERLVVLTRLGQTLGVIQFLHDGHRHKLTITEED